MVLTKNATVSANTGAVTLGGVISENGGSFGLAKSGGGTLTLNGASTFSGGVTLSAGTLTPGVASVGSSGNITSSAIGTGTLTLAGGTLQMNNKTLYNALAITGSATLDETTNNGVLAGPVSGGGDLTLKKHQRNQPQSAGLRRQLERLHRHDHLQRSVSRIHNLLFGSTTTELGTSPTRPLWPPTPAMACSAAAWPTPTSPSSSAPSPARHHRFRLQQLHHHLRDRRAERGHVFSGVFKNSNATATTALTKVAADC